MKIDWITDAHLDHCSPETVRKLLDKVRESDSEVLFLSGDIANALTVENFLRKIVEVKRVYACLGNHDYYSGRINVVRKLVADLQFDHDIVYLQNADHIRMTDTACLVGVDGWGDAHYGLGADTPLLLNDFRYIEDFSAIGDKIRLCRSLGEEAAFLLEEKLAKAKNFDNIVVLTHVPPFWENARLEKPFKGQPDLSGFFGCKAVGDLLLKFCMDNPRKNVTVYSGHVHQKTDYSPLSNLRAITATAVYGQPKIVTIEI